MAGIVTFATLVTTSMTNESLIRAQSPKIAVRANLRLPDEAAGLDAIVRALISVFDQADIVALASISTLPR